jgi:hypothetical protein
VRKHRAEIKFAAAQRASLHGGIASVRLTFDVHFCSLVLLFSSPLSLSLFRFLSLFLSLQSST